MRTAVEHVNQFMLEIGAQDSYYGEAYFLPFQITSLTLKNIGPFEKFEADFRRDSLCFIHGPNGSGKSYILRSILFAFGQRHRYFPENALETGTIKLKIFPDQNSVNLSVTRASKGYQSLIVDNGFERVPTHMVPSLFNELHTRLGCQVIASAPVTLDKEKLGTEVQIISLDYPHYR